MFGAGDRGREELEDLFSNITESATRYYTRRRELAIRGAIIAGYDGIDFNADPLGGVGFAEITPWNRPAPEGANGYRTERYSWDWFSEGELNRLLTETDSVISEISTGGGNDEH